jgi:hypothetical protein
MPLEDVTIRQAKPRDRIYKLSDRNGLHIQITPNDSKLWRWQYRFPGKQKMLAMGAYPDVSLKAAREKLHEHRKVLAHGVDPSAERKAAKRQARIEAADSFEATAREFIDKQRGRWSKGHPDYVLGRLERDVFPELGKRPIAQITHAELLDVLDRIEERGAIEMAHRVRGFCSQIFRYAIARQRATNDPARDLII